MANRGADFVVTPDVRSLGEAMRAHAAARAAHIASMTTANAVSQRDRVSRAQVIAHVTEARTTIAPGTTDEIYSAEFDHESNYLTVAAEA